MPDRVKVSVKGYAELKSKIRDGGEPLYGQPMVEAMELVGFAAEDMARSRAPVFRGALRAGIRHQVSSVRPVPSWVKVETTARKVSRRYPRGYPYPRLLNYWAGSKRFHWLTDAIVQMKPKVESLLSDVAKAIEMKWGSGPIV